MENRNKSKVCFMCLIYFLLFCRLLNAQSAINPANVKIVKKTLYVPPLKEIQAVFQKALSKNFAEAKVETVVSPDLTKDPFHLAAPGLSGNPTILDVGGISYYSAEIQKQKLYDLKSVACYLNYTTNQPFLIGAANGPWIYLKKDCDVVVNTVLNKQNSTARSYVVSLDKTGGGIQFEPLPLNETRFAVQGNLFMSEGKRGKVLKVSAKKRIGKDNFITIMRESIAQHYGEKQLVGVVGGAFSVQKGTVTGLLANALKKPVPKGSKLRRIPSHPILQYYYLFDGSAPMVGVGTFSSGKTDLDLLVEHSHLFSLHGQGGHFMTGATPAIVEYLGYFSLGETLYRIDQAPPFTYASW